MIKTSADTGKSKNLCTHISSGNEKPLSLVFMLEGLSTKIIKSYFFLGPCYCIHSTRIIAENIKAISQNTKEMGLLPTLELNFLNRMLGGKLFGLTFKNEIF